MSYDISHQNPINLTINQETNELSLSQQVPVELTLTRQDPTQITIVSEEPATLNIATLGQTGPSAYQSWLNLGNTGTEADFIQSLASGGLTAGNGLKIIGTELRFDFQSLTRG